MRGYRTFDRVTLGQHENCRSNALLVLIKGRRRLFIPGVELIRSPLQRFVEMALITGVRDTRLG